MKTYDFPGQLSKAWCRYLPRVAPLDGYGLSTPDEVEPGMERLNGSRRLSGMVAPKFGPITNGRRADGSIHTSAPESRWIGEVPESVDGVLGHLGEGVILWDREGRIVLSNQRARDFLPEVTQVDSRDSGDTGITGLLRQAVAGGRLEIPEDQTEERFLRHLVRVHARADGRESVLRSSDGRIWSVRTGRTGAGGRVTVLSEITRRVQTEEHVRRAQKMEALGKLTGGLAHDFNNYLSVIYGYLELLKLEPDLSEDALQFIEAALDGASRGAALTRSLLSFARRQPLDPRPTDAAAAVRETLTLIRRTLGEDIEISLQDEDDLPRIHVDPEQLSSSLLNLANNARDAMPGGGTLDVTVREVLLDEHHALLYPGTSPGRFVLIQVTDSGCGMSPEERARVLEPFYTTKGPGRGTGLGLSMVYGFVTQSGGHLSILSQPGRGTTVRMYLPPAPLDDGEAEEGGGQMGEARGGSETILLVEDNEEVRRGVALQLRSLGYNVLQTARAEEAMELLKREGESIDLLFTDIVMPGAMDGPVLARAATDLLPELGVLFTSGFAGDLLGQAAGGVRIRRLLSKPYRIDDLARAVRGVLDR